MKLKRILTIFLIIVIGGLSISCNESTSMVCAHEWRDANCTTPKFCLKCNATEGEALGHKWIEASCIAPKTCTQCNESEGEIGEHYDSGNGKCKYCEEDIFLMELKEGLNIRLLIPSVGTNNCYCNIKISNNTAYTITDDSDINVVNGAVVHCFRKRDSIHPKESVTWAYYTAFVESQKYDKNKYTLYLDNNSTGLTSFVINDVRVFFRFDINGIVAAGYSRDDVY